MQANLVDKLSVMRLGVLLNMGALILGMAAPVLSQPYPPPPTIIPTTPTNAPGQPVFSPASPPGSIPQPTIIPATPTGGTAQPTFSAPAPANVPRITIQERVVPLSINELVTQWGFTLTDCKRGVVTIRQGERTVCVNPTPQLPPGDYIYDAASNQISPVKVTRQFTFTNPLDYSKCIEDILLLYQDKTRFRQQGRQSTCLPDIFQSNAEQGLSKAQAREMIEIANFHATSLMTQKLYPPRGLREQVAMLFGFIYEIDKNDVTMQQLANQEASATGN